MKLYLKDPYNTARVFLGLKVQVKLQKYTIESLQDENRRLRKKIKDIQQYLAEESGPK
jgi:hypothetical protein